MRLETRFSTKWKRDWNLNCERAGLPASSVEGAVSSCASGMAGSWGENIIPVKGNETGLRPAKGWREREAGGFLSSFGGAGSIFCLQYHLGCSVNLVKSFLSQLRFPYL